MKDKNEPIFFLVDQLDNGIALTVKVMNVTSKKTIQKQIVMSDPC